MHNFTSALGVFKSYLSPTFIAVCNLGERLTFSTVRGSRKEFVSHRSTLLASLCFMWNRLWRDLQVETAPLSLSKTRGGSTQKSISRRPLLTVITCVRYVAQGNGGLSGFQESSTWYDWCIFFHCWVANLVDAMQLLVVSNASRSKKKINKKNRSHLEGEWWGSIEKKKRSLLTFAS